LYVREVATRNNMISEKTSLSKLLEVENIKIENYVDGQLKKELSSDTIIETEPGEENDNTLASGIIPNAGKKILNIFIITIITIAIVTYFSYKDIEI
jgi:hypothetical protein